MDGFVSFSLTDNNRRLLSLISFYQAIGAYFLKLFDALCLLLKNSIEIDIKRQTKKKSSLEYLGNTDKHIFLFPTCSRDPFVALK